MWAISLYGLLPLHLVGGCWGAAGYINTENALGVAIPVRLGDPNIGGVLAGTTVDTDRHRQGNQCRMQEYWRSCLVGLGEPVWGCLLQLS